MAQSTLTPYRSGGGLLGSGFFGNDPFLPLHGEMNRLMEDVLRRALPTTGAESGGSALLAPSMNISETTNEIRITAELPGVTEKDIDLTLNGDVLTIRGEKKIEQRQDKENYHFLERSFGTFQRSLQLPFPVNADQVQASFENGVLTVTLPKIDRQDRARRIQVQAGGQASGTAINGQPGQTASAPASDNRSRSGAGGDPGVTAPDTAGRDLGAS